MKVATPVRLEEELIPAIMETLIGVKHLLISKLIEVLLCSIVRPKFRIPFPLAHRSDVVKTDMDWSFYISRAKARLAKAYSLLSKGVEDEAGEEAWRATIDALNAVSTALWGYEVRSHSGLSKLVDELYRLRIVDVRTEYGNAASPHKNFYQVHLGRLTVSACINRVKELIEKIEAAITDLVERREVLPWRKPLYAALGQLPSSIIRFELKDIVPRIETLPLPYFRAAPPR